MSAIVRKAAARELFLDQYLSSHGILMDQCDDKFEESDGLNRERFTTFDDGSDSIKID